MTIVAWFCRVCHVATTMDARERCECCQSPRPDNCPMTPPFPWPCDAFADFQEWSRRMTERELQAVADELTLAAEIRRIAFGDAT